MAYGIGVGLALLISLFATGIGLDRDRAFYPTVLIVVASYYALFAVMGGSARAIALESLPIAAFLLVAVLGFKRNLWWWVAALVTHGLFDCVHGHLITNPGVLLWWPMFCMTYDLVAAGYLAWRLRQDKMPVTMMVINKDPERAVTARISTVGFQPTTMVAYERAGTAKAITASSPITPLGSYTFKPYSQTLLVLRGIAKPLTGYVVVAPGSLPNE